MKLHFERRRSRSAIWSVRLAIFSAVLLLLSVVSQRIGWVSEPELFWLFVLVVGLALLAVLLACKGFVSLWRWGDKGGIRSLWGLAMAAVVLSPFAFGLYLWTTLPKLNDLSTDLLDPPVFFKALHERTAAMNTVNNDFSARQEPQTKTYPQVTGRRYEGSPDRILEAVMTVLGDERWTVIGRFGVPGNESEILVEAVAYIPILALPSDTVIRLTDEGETTYVDIRSASRYGQYDLGSNAWLINRFLTALDQQVLAPPAEEEG
ncbi:MAG: DUF1499 domain-containing protein [Phyllobacterium sp.]